MVLRIKASRLLPWLLLWTVVTSGSSGYAQDRPEPQTTDVESIPDVPQQVDLFPEANDENIASRLSEILHSTEWFMGLEVRVEHGVVFLSGQTLQSEHKEWANQLASNMEGAVGVVNRISVTERSALDLSPAWKEIKDFGRTAVQKSPLLLLGLIMLLATWFLTKWSIKSSNRLFRRRIRSPLLRHVAARAVAVPVFLLGLFLVLKVSGLTQLAMTVVGGTGLVGLVLGFAFRDIAENFLASILLSMQRPFAGGDLIEVLGHKGFVQSVNTRCTLLMTLDGNHVQIPNATIYKGMITNYTANPKGRFEFLVGIGYDDSISEAQSVALAVARDHQAILDQPEPLVLVESLGPATVNLRVYCWVDISVYSLLKVRSAVIRSTKKAFEEAGISMPDESREVVFPSGVPVRMVSAEETDIVPKKKPVSKEVPAAHSAEGDLSSEAEDIEQQAKESRSPEEGQNLLSS